MTAILAIRPVLLVCGGMILATGVWAGEPAMEHFVGEYRGISVEDADGTWSPSDLDFSIRPHDEGVVMEWSTVTKHHDGKVERQTSAVQFHRTRRKNVYAAAMRPNLFGGWTPLDPFSGDPFMWARYSGSTLTVYSMIISEEGDHEMQVYERTLTGDGVSLRFKRMRNEEALRIVTGTLRRVN